MKTEKKYSFRSGYLFVVMLLVTSGLMAQEYMIEGPATATAGETKNYELLDADNDQPIANIYDTSGWFFSWESLGANSFTGYGNVDYVEGYNITSIDLQFNNSDLIEVVIMDDSGDYYFTDFSISVQPATAPTAPTIPVISGQTCTAATLQKSGNPPSGVIWYWQGTNNSGSSTSYNATSTYNVSATGTYYIRARNSSGAWSASAASVVVTLGTIGGSTNGCSATVSLSNENYIYTIVPQVATTSIPANTTANDYIKNVTYFDGLGRAKQTVAIRQSTSKKDIITHIEYNDLGQVEKEYLPYVPTISGNEGSDRGQANALSGTNSYYATNYATSNPYSQKTIEASPLNRILEQAAPGNDWKKSTTLLSKGYSDGHTIKFEYATNTGSEVKSYGVSTTFANNTYTPSLVDAGNFAANTLSKTITKDENWKSTDGVNHTTEEFKNNQGQVVLKRTYNASIAHDTYYVYDDFGNLTYVIPPKVTTSNISSTELSELCYQYIYDHRNRLVEKKIPGKGWEYIVYDNLDRPVLTQDAILDSQNKWMFTKYDKLGRVAYSGIYSNSGSRISRQNGINTFLNGRPDRMYEDVVSPYTNNGVLMNYTNKAYPNSIHLDILTINYYDDYDFDRAGSGLPGAIGSVYGETLTTNVKGLATVSKVKVLGTSNWITTISYYDVKARPIYVYSKNDFLQTTDIIKSKLNSFLGRVEETTTTHTKTGSGLSTFSVYDQFSYDHAGRLTKQTQWGANISGEQVIVENTYDELGQLKSKGVGGKTTQSRLQTVNYTYNVRGWLKNINQDANNDNDLFNFSLMYNNPTSGTALYNGNISQASWNTLSVDSSTKTYTYSYDALNRIKTAIDNTGEYNLGTLSNPITYDKNGNILTLKREGHIVENPVLGTSSHFGIMDNLVYTYDSGNKLQKVLDNGDDTYGFKDGANTTTEYSYDVNGNMKTDVNKGITNISYNHLNLPTVVTINGQNINYTYDATGTKLRKVVSGVTTNYAGNYVYKNNTLQFYNHAEGYVKNTNGIFSFVYQYKDHLGNIRLSYADTNNNGSIAQSEIVEESNYYPFGLKHKGYNTAYVGGNATAQKFKYNGVELEENTGLYEMDLRAYDPAIARWTSIDPVTHHSMSTYTAFDNNPVFFADPSGADAEMPGWIQNLWDKTDSNTTYYNDANCGWTETDPKEVVKKAKEQFEKGQKLGGKFKKGFKALNGLYSLADGASHTERLDALKDVYNSLGSFLPKGLSFKSFAIYYDIHLALINYQMGIIVNGLKEKNKMFAEIGKQGGFDVGIVYPGAYYGGRELYNYLKVIKHGGKELPILPNQALKFLKEYSGLLSFATGNKVPSALTSLSSTQFWIMKRVGKSHVNFIRGMSTMYIQNNIDSIINIIYGGLKI